MKKTVIVFALIIALFIPSGVSACGRNYHSRHHHWFQRHHFEQAVNDGSYQYYHDTYGMSKAAYLIQIKHMP